MEFGVTASHPEKSRKQCVIVGVYEQGQLSPTANSLNKLTSGQIEKILHRGDIAGKVGQTLILHDVKGVNTPRLMLVGLGKKDALDGEKFNQAIIAAARKLKSTQAKNCLCCLLDVKTSQHGLYWRSRRIVEQFSGVYYTFTEMKGSKPKQPTSLNRVDLQISTKANFPEVKRAIKDGIAVALGISAAKDLANRPGNICTPTHIASAAKAMAKEYAALSTRVLEETDMKKLGMGSLLSVGHGSAEPSKLIVMKYKGGKSRDKPYVLVGKGITFDSGGISLKPGANMHEMIYDMCGAASVFGAMKAVAEQNLPINVVVVIAAAENMPSDRATRPGDIVTSMSGQTIEILNTDAEGRLVLCDALTYIEKFNPVTVIDVATLTGAIVIALGSVATGLYANDDALAKHINEAGQSSLDKVWRMPLWDEYQPQLNSAHADMANIGGRAGGSVTAACFLGRFTKKYKWAHLDVAGTAFRGSGASKGATGRPVGVLIQYLMDRAAKV